MIRLTIGKLVLATCITAVATTPNSQAQGVDATQLLAGGTSCLHVIQQIQIHGVNNSFDVGASGFTTHPSPFGPYVVPEAELGDLEIVQISQLQQADPACGPQFNVTVRNNSCRDVCNFHVTVVATLGRIFPGSPNATSCVEKLCAGAAVDVCLQLPVEALAMGNLNGQVIGFQRLVVAIDSFDELAETNEANNLRALSCAEIPIAAAVVVEPANNTVVSETMLSGVAAPAMESTNIETPAGGLQPTVAVQPSDGVSSGGMSLDGEPPATDALRSAIRMMDQPTGEQTVATATP